MIEALHSKYLWHPGRVFNLCPLFVLDLNHLDQWNTLLFVGGEIFQLTNMVTPLGNEVVYHSFWSSSVCKSCPNLSSFFNSLQSDLLSDWLRLGLKPPDMFRSESFWYFMLCFHTQFNSICLDIAFFWLDPSLFLCFGHLQGTTHVLLARSGATAWIQWARSGSNLKLPVSSFICAVLGRPCNRLWVLR